MYDGLDTEKVLENKLRIAKFRSHIEDDPGSKRGSAQEKLQREVDFRREYLEQVRSQEESGAQYPQFRNDVRKALTDFQEPEIDKRELEEIFEQQEYLRQTVPKVSKLTLIIILT